MKKWLRNVMCFLLATAMTLVTVSPLAQIEASAQDGATKFTITGISGISAYGSSMDYLSEMYFTTDASWNSTGKATVSGQKIQISDTNVSVYGIQTQSNGSFLLQHWKANLMDNGNLLVIPAGLTFQMGDVTYELAQDFKFKYTKGSASNNGTYEIVTTPEPAPAAPTKVTITGISAISAYGSSMDYLSEMYFTTDASWNSTGKATVSGQKIQINDTNVSVYGIQTQSNGSFLLQHWKANLMDNGNLLVIPAGLTFQMGDVTYELAQDFKFKYTKGSASNNGTYEIVDTSTPEPPTPVNADVTVAGTLIATATEVYLKTNLADSHQFAGAKFTTSDITITRGGATTPIANGFTLHKAEGICNIYFSHAFQAGDVVKIKRDGTATNTEKAYTITFTNEYALQYDGSKWSKYEEQPVQPPTPVSDNVSVTGALVTTATELYLKTNLSDSHQFAGAKFATSDITITRGGVATAIPNGFTLYKAEGICNIYFSAIFQEGDIIKIKAGGTAKNDAKAYTITFTNDYALQYDGSKWSKYEEPPLVPPTPVNADVKVVGVLVATATEVYLKTNLATSHEFAGAKFATSDITITRGGVATAIPNGFTLYKAEGICNIYFSHIFEPGDIVKIKAGGTAKNNAKAYTITFTNDYALQFDGSKWTKYEEPPLVPPTPSSANVNVPGALVTTPTELYLKTNLSDSHKFAGAKFTTSDITITRDGVATAIPNGFTLHKAEGISNIYFSHIFQAGDIVKIKKGGTATNTAKAYTIKFTNNYALQFDGTKWSTYIDPEESAKYSYITVDLSGIYVQGGNDLYLTTGIKDTHKYKGLGFVTSDIQVFKANGSKDKITRFSLHPSEGKLYVAFSYLVEEGLGIHIPKGATGVNTANECGVKFAKNFSLFYTNGKWVVDNDAPVITYRGEDVIAGELYGLRLGMTKADVEALFVAKDAIQGKKKVVFTYPKDMFGADGKLQKGTFKMTVSASDNSGNIAKHTIQVKGYSKDAPTITFKGAAEREFDAGKKFDIDSLKASAKDGNGKKLTVKFSYSKGALDKKGALKQGTHKLYLTATDDEGQSFTRAITLNCYEFTNIKVTGFYYVLNNEIYFSTNMKNAKDFKGGWLTSDNILVNGKSGVIPWVSVDKNAGLLYILCEKHPGDTITIAEGATFVDKKNLVGIRVENAFQAHTDGIGWIVDRIRRGGSTGSTGSTGAPQTGDTTPWCGYAAALIMAAGVMFVVQKKKKQS